MLQIFINFPLRKKFALLFLLLCGICLTTTGLFARTFYVTPRGSAGNDGSSFTSPLNFTGALNLAAAGDTILLQGGTYTIPYSSGLANTIVFAQSGQAGRLITVQTDNNAQAVFDFSFPPQEWVQDAYGFSLTGSYWSFKGISITRAGYQGVYITGAHNTFENCAFYDNRNTGMEINKGGSYTTVINCDAYRNYDPKKFGSMADGFGPKQTQGAGNKFIGCRAWENSDDGYDCFDSPETVTFENCWAFRNGIDVWQYGGFTGNGNGFKLGGNAKQANNKCTNCVAFGQPKKGFDQNNNTGGLTLYNCLAYQNGTNFGLGGDLNAGQAHVLRNNVSLDGPDSIANAQADHNTWNSGYTVSGSDFLGLELSLAAIKRNPAGTIPQTDLFRLRSTSKLIDAGVNVGLPYNGKAPDIGCFETTSQPAGLTGDVNNSGTIDIIDALMIAQYSANLNPTGFNSAPADATKDGRVDILDALRVAQFSAGIIGTL